MSRDHRVHIESDAASGCPAVEFLAVIRSQSFSGLQDPRRAATWRCQRNPRGAAWKTGTQTHDHDADGSSHRLRSVAGPVHHGQGRRAVRRLGGVQARTQRTLPNQALDCVDHKHGPNRKLDQIPVENPVSITGGSGSYPDR